ncbi:MAG TPA: hypothetical protein VIA18_02780 [Polyangia bacterium]|jgi:tetratricopeptide (TPR) repeat protein|nr:hypothetical protein [Polyangia bacterium]
MKALTWITICLAVSLTTTVARGDDPAAARLHYKEGTNAFDLGLYDKSIAEYMKAYQAVNDPALLYNLAQAHRLAGHVRDALRFYRVYLQRLPNAENRPEVEEKIGELKLAVDRLDHAQNGLQPDHTLDGATPPATASASPPANAVVPPPPPAPPPPGRNLRIAGIATGAAGVGSLVVGIAFGALAESASSSLTSTSHAGGFYDPGKYSSGHTDQIVEGVTLGIGAAAVATGVVLYVLGRRAASHERTVAWQR